jgi:hypothetical protein
MTCALFSLTAISVVDLQLPGEEEEPARSDEHASPRAQSVFEKINWLASRCVVVGGLRVARGRVVGSWC